jgi:ribosomal protein S18 acetylase RimI-like enzyme
VVHHRPVAAFEVERFEDGEAFLARAAGFLGLQPERHYLTFAIAESLRSPEPGSGAAFIVAVRDGLVDAAVVGSWGNILLSEVADPAVMVALAGALPPGVESIHGPLEHAAAFASAVATRQGCRVVAPSQGSEQRLYAAERITRPSGVSGALRPAIPSDRDLLVDWAAAFEAEALGEHDREHAERLVDGMLAGTIGRTAYVWVAGGRPVSMAHTAGPTHDAIRVSGVYTPPGLRGQGFGSAVTAAVGQAELDRGRARVFLFADLANPVSNRIYERIGFVPVRDIGWLELIER